MTIRKAGKIVRLLDQALDTAKRTQIRLMEAQIEVPREDTDMAIEIIHAVEEQTNLVSKLMEVYDTINGLHDELVSIANAGKE